MLVRTVVELADNLVDDFDVIDLLSLLSDRCVDVLDVTAAGVMLASPTGDLRVAASSSEAMRVLELLELQASEGPCVDAFHRGAPVVHAELSAVDGRWPSFSPAAIERGFRAVHALPMRLRGTPIGALNLFRSRPGALAEADLIVAQALADVATITILQHQASVDAQLLTTQLNEALQSRIAIEQAKGMVSQATGVDMDTAFRRLRMHSRNHNHRLSDVARQVAGGQIRPTALDTLTKRRP